MDIIEVRNLSVKYSSGKKSVRDCSFSVRKGEVFGLLGSNGAGKSTILQVFAGLIKNFSGSVRILGEETRFGGGSFSEVAYVPQSPCMFTDFTVRENLSFFCSMEGLGYDERQKRMDHLLETFSLERFQNMPAGRLSGGYRQLLNVALSSILEKKIVLMDEPTAGLDLWAKRKIAEHIRGLKAKGKTVVLTTHDLADAEDICDNVVILSDGNLLAQGDIKTLLRELGGGYTISVTLSRPPSRAFRVQHSRISRCSATEVVAESNPSDVGPAVRELMGKLESADAVIQDLKVREPSLGFVFSNLLSKVKK